MKKLTALFSPYLLLLIPVFIGLVVLLLNPDQELLKQDIALHASFFQIPNINLFDVVVSLFKCPNL